MPIFRQTLDEMRNYHRLLMTGGRWAATLAMVLALAAQVGYRVHTHIVDERQHFAMACRLVSGRLEANEHSFLDGVIRAELSWGDDRAVSRRQIDAFRVNGNFLRWKPFPSESLELLMVGVPGVDLTDTVISRYLALSEQVARANIAASKVLKRPLTQYFFSADRQIVVIVPSSAVTHPERLRTQAGKVSFVDELVHGGDDFAAGAIGHASGPSTAVRWLPNLYDLPTGKRALRLGASVKSGGKTVAILINEVQPDDLISEVSEGNLGGNFAIVSDSGEVISMAARRGADRRFFEHVASALRDAPASAHALSEQWLDGRIVFSQRLGGTGFSFVYSYSWTDVIARIWATVAVATTVMLAAIAAIWLLLRQLNRRVFLPIYERSELVFESEHLSRTVIDAVPVAIGLVSTRSGKLLYGGSSLSSLSDVLTGEMPELLQELVRRYARVKAAHAVSGVFQEDVTMTTRDGSELALQARFALGSYRGEEVLVIAFVDMTANRQLHRQLREAKLAADQANSAKSAFLAAMSHEIRTPLNAILGNLELLAYSPLNPLQRDRLQTIRTSSSALLAIIRDVLDFSKIEAGAMQFERIRFDITEVMTHALTVFAPVAQAKGIALYGAFDVSIGRTMHGDPVRLGQVVHNLLSNAIKFTACGKVTLNVGYQASQDGRENSGTLVITVADTGIGIDASHRGHIFKAFSQADCSISRRFGGTGLGLALCERLLTGMGGTIACESEVGQGSRFTVHVPMGQSGQQEECNSADARRFVGERVTFLAAADEWHAYAVPLMSAWGIEVDAHRHPSGAIDDGARVLVVCGDRSSWSPESENQLVEESPMVIHCSVDGPLHPIQAGKASTVSCYSPDALRTALEWTFYGKPPVLSEKSSKIDQMGIGGEASFPQRLDLRVLVAEDNEFNRRLLIEQLTLLGCTVEVSADGVEALKLLSDRDFDVLLTDLNMPRKDGYALAKTVRARLPGMPIIAITADAGVDEHARCAEFGIETVLSKPLSIDGLAHALSHVQILDGRRLARATVNWGQPASFEMPPAVIDAFHRSYAKSLDVLSEALKRGDEATALDELHTLKGALGVFRQGALRERCGEVERRIKLDGLDAASDRLREFIVELSDEVPEDNRISEWSDCDSGITSV